jgi:subtilisin family serine protease
VLVILAVLAARFEAPLMAAVSLTAVAPLGASAGVVVQITGTGFDPVASNNTVTLTVPGSASASVVGETIAVLDAAKGLRRLGITVPAGLAIGNAAIVVTNTITREAAGGRTLQIIDVTLPQTTTGTRGGPQLGVRVAGSSNVQFVSGRTTVSFGSGITVASVQVESATSLVATITIAANAALGPRTVTAVTSTQTARAAAPFTVLDPNRAPAFTSSPVLSAVESQPYAYQATATDPDGDAVTFRRLSGPDGLTVSTSGLVAWTPGATQVGNQDVALEAADGRGGAAQQTYRISIAAAPRLDSIEAAPELLRFGSTGQVRNISVTGRRSDGQTVNLTAPGTGTTYESTNRFVAAVAPDGSVTAVGNGEAVITARNGSLSDSVPVIVETGASLQSLQLNPPATTLRNAGETQGLTLIGRFSDGTSRDLTTAAGTTYASSNQGFARVAADGLVTAVADGQVSITAKHDTLETTASVIVSITTGTGFLRGEVYDDSRGLPLAGATVMLVTDGGGTPGAPTQTTADARGQFSIRGRAGEAIIRITKPGFTTVERRGQIPANAAATVLDARLTPLDIGANPMASATGGTARDERHRVTLQIAPGGLPADAALTLTLVSPQGLEGRLPAGWSPIAAVSIEPALTFSFPLTLTLPHLLPAAPSGAALTLARYDRARHEWVTVAGQPQVGPGGSTVVASIDRSGQFAVIAPDVAPSAPPVAVVDESLRGIDLSVDVPPGMTAAGEVIPRSAPPGESARALGRVGLIAPGPIVSGTIVQVRVSERFDLLDSSQLYTLPFTQDLVAYALPRQNIGGSVGASFPVTPSRDFTIQQLMLGAIRLDVHGFVPDATARPVGSGGGTISNAEGDALIVPAGALLSDAPIVVRRVDLAGAGITLPSGFALIAAVQVEAPGTTFGGGTQLSTAAAGLSATDQILVTRVFTDPLGQRRLRLVALGEVASGRLVTQTALGVVSLEGIRAAGEFVFLKAGQPVGFVTGTVVRAGGAAVPAAVVTSDSLAVADLSSPSGAYLVPVAVGAPVTLRADDAASGDSGTASRQLDSAGQVVPTTLTLAVVGPSVLSVIPAGGSTNVALDTSITIDFSEPISAESVGETSVVLQDAGGVVVASRRTLSADGKRLLVRPNAPLAAKSTYTLRLTAALRDASGNALTAITSLSFSTLDPSRAAAAAGLIVAAFPDEEGWTVITGATGATEPRTAIVAINPRTQETAAVLSLEDGSFRVLINVAIGDEVTLTLRLADGRETSLAITQFEATDGTTAIGVKGGTIRGPDDRVGQILPRALKTAGLFRIAASTAAPALDARFVTLDRFALRIDAAEFEPLDALTLTESQNRVAPATASGAPFASAAQVTVPADFLINAALRFTAAAVDRDGSSHSITAETVVVSTNPDGTSVESGRADEFPTVFLTVPSQATPNQVIAVSAVAPTARIELTLPVVGPPPPDHTILLTRVAEVNGEQKLAVVDRLERITVGGVARLRSAGRNLPGLSRGGDYVVVSGAIAFVSGRSTGPAATILADGSPFIAETDGANGQFILPVPAGSPFTLRFLDAATGAPLGVASGQAPAAGGSVDVGSPLTAPGGVLTITAEPDRRSGVDVATSLVFTFSEPIDRATVIPNAFVVTDSAGARAFGRIVIAADDRSVTFVPLRRWKFDQRYRYGVATSVVGAAGGRLPQPFTGEFTTFRPQVVTSMAVGTARDIDVAAGLAAVATQDGMRTLDVSSPLAPTLLGEAAVPGGANAIVLMPQSTITDRNGTARSGTFAIVASGTTDTAGRLQTFDVSAGGSPAMLGSTQLTTPAGQTAPAGVPPFAGIPSGVTTDSSGRALVAIDGVGLSTVRLGDAIPVDAANPGRGLGLRYPPTAAGSASDVALAGGRAFVVGDAGLTVLDAANLNRGGGAATSGNARGVAALEAFSLDVNGDGTVNPDSEVLDLVLVANGADGTLQIYRAPPDADPVLLSVVRFAGETTSVAVSAAERLAYVGLGARGVGIVDLDGPASVQPIDDDHNGVDDRVLGVVDTPGSADRLALALDRGVGFVADGPAGVTILQLLPARTRFLTLLRDPVKVIDGEEESIADTLVAFATDDALRATLNVIEPPTEPLVLAIEESGTGGRLLRFAGGQTVAPLSTGLNSVEILFDKSVEMTERAVALSVLDAAGRRLSRIAIAIRTPDLQAVKLESVRVGPETPAALGVSGTLQLGVAGYFDDGSVFNLTSAASGTEYTTGREVVATVDTAGLVTAHAGGVAVVAARNHNVGGSVRVRVDAEHVLMSLSAEPSLATFRTLGEGLPFPLLATFSDGEQTRSLAAVAGLTFASADSSIASVGVDGRIRAEAEGVTDITAARGDLRATVTVAVDPRTPSSIEAIVLAQTTAPLSLDDTPLFALATISGSGALDGLPVTVTLLRDGVTSTETQTTDLSGVVAIRLDRTSAPGSVSVTASIVDPATANVRSDSRLFLIAPGTGDVEPNDSPTSAAPLRAGRATSGSVNASTDRQDTYVLDTAVGGALEIDLRLGDNDTPQNVVIVIRDANGQELARITPTARVEKVAVPVTAGAARISVESLNGAVQYQLTATVVQGDVTVGTIAPMSGPPGTLLTIDGSGFSPQLRENQVFFSGIPAEVVSATSTRLQVRVPANAPNGTVEVISGDRRVDVDGFVTGLGVRPQAYVTPNTLAGVRRDPISHVLVDINRLLVSIAPAASSADVEAMASRSGGHVVGFFPFTNQYVLEFPQNRTFDGLNALRQRVALEAQVRSVSSGTYFRLATVPSTLDIFDRGGMFTNGAREWGAFEQIELLGAIQLVRSTPLFTDRAAFKDVHVAVIDSGFDPRANPNEFLLSTNPVVEYLTRLPVPFAPYRATTAYSDGLHHGTNVASVIAAVNDGNTRLSGVMNSFFEPSELPFPVHVYRAEGLLGEISFFDQLAAMDHIRARSPAIDVINLSLGGYSPNCRPIDLPVGSEVDAIAAFRGRTLIVAAAGNDGVEARCHFPAAFSLTEPHVISVGATAVDSGDGTPGESPDDRATFTHTDPPAETSRTSRRCSSSVPEAGSNCNPGVTLAAPGEDILPLEEPDLNLSDGIMGTSFSAPIVSGVAAILQAIRSQANPLPPSQLRSILTSTATTIRGLWDANRNGETTPMARLNALAAVEAVLPIERSDAVYVADRKATGTGSQTGTVVVVNVDPVAGVPASGGSATTTIDLTVRRSGQTLAVGEPRSIVTSPDGTRLYVFASAPDPYGDGILIIDGTSRRTLSFVPLSGTPFPIPTGGQANQPFRNFLPRPSMALSRDGRLLYVSTGIGVRILNTLSGKIVTRIAHLPGNYNTLAQTAGSLRTRLDALEHRILTVAAGTPGGAFVSALEMAPDGRTLFVVVKRGMGTGTQPGAVLSIDVDLYTDDRPLSPGLQSRLTSYFNLRAAFAMQSNAIPGSDEPSDAAITPDGQRLYVVNGGVNAFSPAGTDSTQREIYALRVVQAGSPTVDPNLVQDVERTLAEGVTVLHAPGTIDVFDAAALGAAERRFVSDVNFGWSPSPESGGLVISPVRFGEVFAKRPGAIAIRPDGKRALVAYLQTGNFGVLDVDAQELFKNETAAVAAVPGLFTGVTGVTPAVPMTSQLVPRDTTGRLLQFPTQIEYSQNGGFAAATHSGAVSIINDKAINDDITTHARVMEPSFDGQRPYFSKFPICASRNPTGAGCEREVSTPLFEFVDRNGQSQPFVMPLGLAIAPIIELRAPSFGDHITKTTEIHARWGHAGVVHVSIHIVDVGPDGTSAPTIVGSFSSDVTASQRSVKVSFGSALTAPVFPGRRYRIRVIADSASSRELSRASIDVTLR